MKVPSEIGKIQDFTLGSLFICLVVSLTAFVYSLWSLKSTTLKIEVERILSIKSIPPDLKSYTES